MNTAGTSEVQAQRLARYGAATLALAAGALHLAQIGPHSDEDPLFGIFFLVVGVIQAGGGLYLLRPLGQRVFVTRVAWFGVTGSLLTIAIWAASRTTGLPFGAEPGSPETVGLADAAAGVFELLTALLLLMWLMRAHADRFGRLGRSAALLLAATWIVTRVSGRFDPDPRLVAFSEFADAAAIGFLVTAAVFFGGLAPGAALTRTYSRMINALFLALLVSASSLVVFTVPARGGQNRDCLYAPIREDSGLSHTAPIAPIALPVGQSTSVVALLLVACADASVQLTDVTPLAPLGDTAEITAITIDRARAARSERVRPPGGGTPAVGTVLVPGQGRYPVVLEIHALRPGAFFAGAFRIDYASRGLADYTGFASSVFVCVGDTPCSQPSGH